MKLLGGVFVPVCVPLKPTWNGAPVASVAFHGALLEMVTCELPAG